MFHYSLGMEHENSAKKCLCRVRTECTVPSECDCNGLCILYEPELSKIVAGNFWFTTIAPKGSSTQSQQQIVDEWLHNLEKLLYCTDGILITMELTKKHVPHFHMIYKVMDKIKHSKLIYSWAQDANVEPIRHHKPKHDFHYFFKDCQKTFDATGIVPIICHEDLLQRKQKRKELRKKLIADSKVHRNPLDDIPIPKWFTGEAEERSSS